MEETAQALPIFKVFGILNLISEEAPASTLVCIALGIGLHSSVFTTFSATLALPSHPLLVYVS